MPLFERSRATLVASLTRAPQPGDLEALCAIDGGKGVEWLEVRADLVGDLDAGELRARFPGKLLYTLRSAAEGGAFGGGASERRERLQRAAQTYDRVDLEVARDLGAELLAAVPAEQRLISWHGPGAPLAALEERLASMLATPAALYKLIVLVKSPGEALRPLELLFHTRRQDVVAFAAGASGTWTRLLAPWFGAPWVYGSVGEDPAAPGQLSIARLVADYALPALHRPRALCGVIGNPALHSLSPRLHNACYRALGIPLLYVPFEAQSLADFWLEVAEDGALADIGVPLRGLSVTTPFKASAIAVAGALSPLAERLSVANTLLCRDGVWEGDSTDGEGVLLALGWRGIRVAGKRVAVIGTGGAGRVAALALELGGADVLIVNRDEARGAQIAAGLELPFAPLQGFSAEGVDILVQATSLGRNSTDPLPFDVDGIAPGAAVVDLVYGAEPTPLLQAAAARGAVTIDGREVLLGQAVSQFHLMAGQDLPLAVGRAALGLPLDPLAANAVASADVSPVTQ